MKLASTLRGLNRPQIKSRLWHYRPFMNILCPTIPCHSHAVGIKESQERELQEWVAWFARIPSKAVIVSVTGTKTDPQGYSRQVKTRRAAGMLVAASN